MNRFTDTLDALAAAHRLRTIPEEGTDARIDLLSNDYLGLGARCEEFREEFLTRFPDASFSSSASRLLSRRQKYHSMLEERLGSLYSRRALLFNSGYHANTGVLSALAGKGTLLLVDRLMHASAIDGVMMVAGARKGDYRRFRHNDMEDLERIIREESERYNEFIVVTESVFSMDGDTAPLRRLVEIKRRYPGIIIYLDEAHAFGVRGSRGLGLAEELGLTEDIDIIAGTFGKAIASSGAFVAARQDIIDFLVNTSRSFIFSTALPPACQAWTMLMMEKAGVMSSERESLLALARDFASRLREVLPATPAHAGESQVIPLMCGSAEKALEMAGKIRDAGYDALPIRRPTVPPGGERVRLSLNASLSIADLLPLLDSVRNDS